MTHHFSTCVGVRCLSIPRHAPCVAFAREDLEVGEVDMDQVMDIAAQISSWARRGLAVLVSGLNGSSSR